MNAEDAIANGFAYAQAALGAKSSLVRNAMFEKALMLLKPHANTVPRAAFGIALLCEKSAPPSTGTGLFFDKAADYYRLAASLPDDGHGTPLRAMNGLGSLFAERHLPGAGIDQEAEAVRWKRAAADAGFAEAQMTLARWHYAGRFVARDFALSRQWMQQAYDNSTYPLHAELKADAALSLILIDREIAKSEPATAGRKRPYPLISGPSGGVS
jgi:TPR repeat protein